MKWGGEGNVTDALAAVDVAKKSFIAVEFGGTLLARMAPRFAHSGAAQLFGANHALQLALAHVVTYVGEARTCPVVYRKQISRVRSKISIS